VNAGEDLKNHAEHAKGHPAEEHEAERVNDFETAGFGI
jgi:hypothetical protein